MGADAQAQPQADPGGELMRAIGQMNCFWSNNESLLIHILRILLRTDEVAAAIVFATVNTTRARLDLVARLAKAKVADTAMRGELADLMRDFSELTRLRNELTHCIFVFDAQGHVTHTQTMKIEEGRGRLRFGVRRAFDGARVRELEAAVVRANALNAAIWRLLPRLEQALAPAGGHDAAVHAKARRGAEGARG